MFNSHTANNKIILTFIAAALLILFVGDLYSFSSSPQTNEKQNQSEFFLMYAFGAKFEPPEGKIIHGMGQWQRDNEAYLDMLGSESIYPLTMLFFFDLENTRPWDMVRKNLAKYLDYCRSMKMIPNLNLGMSGARHGEYKKKKTDILFGLDDKVARTARYDRLIHEIASILDRYGEPVFLRIAGEFNGWWNGQHPYDYPKAFRKIVRIFREAGADNVAFVWCYESSAANDFDETNSRGEYKWFPGDDVIDWYSIDVFARKDFSDAFPEFSRGSITAKGKSERFLKMAKQHRKPVIIAESSVVDYLVTSPQIWNEWFAPYFSFIARHPVIKAFVYVNANWPKYSYQDWTDGRINLNERASARYRQEIQKDKYLHKGEGKLLNDFEKYKNNVPARPQIQTAPQRSTQ